MCVCMRVCILHTMLTSDKIWLASQARAQDPRAVRSGRGGCVKVFSLTVTMVMMDYVTFYAERSITYLTWRAFGGSVI